MLTRREWIKLTTGAMVGAALPGALAQAGEARGLPGPIPPVPLQPDQAVGAWVRAGNAIRSIPDYETPMFDLPGQIKDRVQIESIELLRRGTNYFVRTRSTGGAVGLAPTKQVNLFVPIFKSAVAPYFIGKDARDIETLVDGVYIENYKLAGLAFWCPVAYIEQSILDMLGNIAGKPIGALLGGVVRKEIPVYLSGSDRILKAEEEVGVYIQGVPETGTKAVKFKIGGRMSRNIDTYPGRTETVLKIARQKLGDQTILYADANGSYDSKTAIEIGHILESLNYKFFEEPCPFEELSETQAVKKALKIDVAFGEQDTSLWLFQWMLNNGVMDIAQPDINYNGGLIRAARVARMAERLGKTIAPHNTQTGVASVNILQFASYTRNIAPFMEYPWRRSQRPETWYTPNFIIKNGMLPVPEGPGMGIQIDPDYLAGAEVVAKIP